MAFWKRMTQDELRIDHLTLGSPDFTRILVLRRPHALSPSPRSSERTGFVARLISWPSDPNLVARNEAPQPPCEFVELHTVLERQPLTVLATVIQGIGASNAGGYHAVSVPQSDYMRGTGPQRDNDLELGDLGSDEFYDEVGVPSPR